jgi:hypothetical protein
VGINTALVDRARRVANVPTGQRVEGTTIFETYHYPWFRCRLTLNPSQETSDQHGGRMRVRQAATMMCGVKDKDGGVLTIASDDRLEVDSKELGRGLYEITSDGEPIRKKKKVIGWQATLTRVDEHAFDRPEP